LKASETDLKNIMYCDTDKREVLEYEYAQLSHECIKQMELREASENYNKSLQKLTEDCEKLQGQLKELEEVVLPIVRLPVLHSMCPR
jgi:hypothetical protein